MRQPAWSRLLLPALLCLLAGCGSAPVRTGVSASSECLERFAALDARVERAGLHDASAMPIRGFPYLRLNRVLASFRDADLSPAARLAWLYRLGQLDAQARALELSALGDPPVALDDLSRCRETGINALASNETDFRRLRGEARVPDAYSTTARVLGLYPLAAAFARHGVARMQAVEAPVEGLQPGQQLRSYGADRTAGLRAFDFAAAPRDALGFPVLTEAQTTALLARHAPVWLVARKSPDDHIGTVSRDAAGNAQVEGSPSEYRYLSYTRFGPDVLLQLNYMVWFPARTPGQRFDLLAGRFDAVIWRVTLDMDGTPLLHDSVHACGCYQLWWPGSRLSRRPGSDDTEPPWLPFPLTLEGRLAIQLDAGTHYLRALGPAPATVDEVLEVRDYDDLRRLPAPGGRPRSLFGTDGLVHESARPERYLLWPLGVPAAGSMRQQGHQATAFIGRRHVDDAFGIERYFARAGAQSSRASPGVARAN